MVEPSVERSAYKCMKHNMKKKGILDNFTRNKKTQDTAIDRKIVKSKSVKSLPDITNMPVTKSNMQYDDRDSVMEGRYRSLTQLVHIKDTALDFYDATNSGCYDVHTPYQMATIPYNDEEGGVSANLRRLEQEERILNKRASSVINGRTSQTASEKRLFRSNYGKLRQMLDKEKFSDAKSCEEYMVGNGRRQCCYPCRKKPTARSGNTKVEGRRKNNRSGSNTSSPRAKSVQSASGGRKEKEVDQNNRRRNGSSSGLDRRVFEENNGSESSYEGRSTSEFSDKRGNLEFSNEDYSDISRGGNGPRRRVYDEEKIISDDILREQSSREYRIGSENLDLQRTGNEGNSPGRAYTRKIDIDTNENKRERIEVCKNIDKSPASVHVVINIDKDQGCKENELLQKWREEIFRICRDNTIRSRDKSDSSYYSPPETKLTHQNLRELVEQCKKCIKKCPKEGKINLKKYIEKLLRMSNGSVDELEGEEEEPQNTAGAFIKDMMDKECEIDNLDYNKDEAAERPRPRPRPRPSSTRPREYPDDFPSPLEDRFPKQLRIPSATGDKLNQTFPRPSRSPFGPTSQSKNLSYPSETFDGPNYSEVINGYCDSSHDMPLAPTTITHGEVDKVESLKNCDYKLPSDSTLELLEKKRAGEEVNDDEFYEDQGVADRAHDRREYKSFEVPRNEREFQDDCERRITDGVIAKRTPPRSQIKQSVRGTPSTVEKRFHMQRKVEVNDERKGRVTEITEEEVKQSSTMKGGYDLNDTLPDFDFFVKRGFFNKEWDVSGKETEHDPDDFLKPPPPSMMDKKVMKTNGAGKANLLGRKIGLPWVESTLKRTQEASALSSSSNEDFVDEARKRRSRWRSQNGSVDLARRNVDDQKLEFRPSLTHGLGLMSINDKQVHEPREREYFHESTPKKGRRSKKYVQQFDGDLSEIYPDDFTHFPSDPVNVSRTVPNYATIPEDDPVLYLPTECRKLRRDLRLKNQQ